MLIFDLDGTLIDSPDGPGARPGAPLHTICRELIPANPRFRSAKRLYPPLGGRGFQTAFLLRSAYADL